MSARVTAGRTLQRAPDPKGALDGPLLEAVRAVARMAAARAVAIYFVGGVPRDLVLGRPIGTDVDLVAVGDAMALARAVRDAEGGHVLTHTRFRTATWRRGAVSIDVVTARDETYAHPGALPDITPGSLDVDLARRDFTLNTLAIPITPNGFGDVIDRHGALADLAAGTVRVLHALSFVDDPTRIIRAVRTEVRLGFRMDATTARLARAAVTGLPALSGARLRAELIRVFAEPDPVTVLGRLHEIGALAACGPEPLAADPAKDALAALAERATGLQAGGTPDAVGALLAWLAANGPAGVRVGHRLHLSKPLQRDLERAVSLAEDPALVEPGTPASAVNGTISRRHPTALALILAAAATSQPLVRARLDAYAAHWALRPLPIDGHDLADLGFPAGPRTGAALGAVRNAWWDGTIATRDEAIGLARRLLAAACDDGLDTPDAPDAML